MTKKPTQSYLMETTPLPAFLRGLQNQSWTVSGAISELVDNSFGGGRGDAQRVELTWYAKDRVLTVLDDGRGMDNIARLFQLGNTIGRRPGDIGEFGSGGTMALIWLARAVNVWTMKNGQVALTSIDWNKQIRKNAFPQINTRWYPATATNTPQELLAVGHGTYIALKFLPKRTVYANNIRAELATTYGPAIRQGRTLVWRSRAHWDQTTLLTDDATSTEWTLGDPLEIPDAVPLTVDFELEGQRLQASGKAGRIDGLTISQSSIAVGFGYRLLLKTKDCYHSKDETFSGVGVTGYLDLADGWQPFLSTTKNAIDDNRAWDQLMKQVFQQLRPLLEASDRQAHSVFFADLGLELEKMFDDTIRVSLPAAPDEVEPPVDLVTPVDDEDLETPEPRAPRPPHQPPTESGAVVQLKIDLRTDSEMEGLLCRVEAQGNRLMGHVNDDHPFVKTALIERPPNRLAFHNMVAHAVANGVIDQFPDLLEKMFDRITMRRLQAHKDEALRRGLVVRLLMDRVRAA